jgi:hypothetical protein
MNFGRLTGTSTRTARSTAERRRQQIVAKETARKSAVAFVAAAKVVAREQLLDRVMPNGKKVRDLGKRDAAKYGREHSGFGKMLTAASATLATGQVIGDRYNEGSFKKLAS